MKKLPTHYYPKKPSRRQQYSLPNNRYFHQLHLLKHTNYALHPFALDAAKIRRITDCFASYGLPVHVPRALPLDALMKKMALDKKNRGTTIRCTIVTDIGVSLAQPQPVSKQLMRDVMAASMAEGEKHAEWAPHEGKVAVAAAGGIMAS